MMEVAKLAGVSAATVSRVLSGSTYPVREATRSRVVAAADKLGFQPNMLARGLVTARTCIVGAIVHDVADPYYGEIVRGIEDQARTCGYQVLVSSSDRDAERELEILRLLLSYQVDGIVFAGGAIDDAQSKVAQRRLLDEFTGRGRAVVRLAPHDGDPAVSVTVDNEAAACAMAEHLLRLGHRVVGIVDGPQHLSTAQVRRRGWQSAFEDAGIARDPELTVSGHFTSEGGSAATAELIARRPDLTAIFALNDVMALGVLHELSGRGLRVPDDVSVAGFDDVHIAQFVQPPLTTVRVPMRRLGQEAFRAAMAVLEGGGHSGLVLPTDVLVRASTAAPRETGELPAEGRTPVLWKANRRSHE